MSFEKFDKRDAAAANKAASVTVLKNGLVSLTWRAYTDLGQPDAVQFLFDRSRRVVALESVDKNADGAYAVRKPKDGVKGAVSVRGTAMLEYYGLTVLERYRTTPFMEDGYLCFKMPKTNSGQDPDPKVSADEDDANKESPI